MIKTIGSFVSNNKQTEIKYYIYMPEREINPKAILQISHGMCEYIERYEEFAEFMTANGIIVCGNDHLGHGRTAANPDELGYFGSDNGNIHLTEDLRRMYEIMRKTYRRLPYVILGHSMGSFILRAYMTRYGDDLDGAIICGTNGGDSPVKAGLLLANVISVLKGKRYRSKTLRNIAFKDYNSHYADENNEFSWLTKEVTIRDKYINDEHCNFIFTAKGYGDMFKILKEISSEDWAASVPLSLPIMVISGDDDPVGNYGKGVELMYNRLVDAEINDVTMKLYKNDRHEILNETDRHEVFEDILGFVNRVYDGVIELNMVTK